MGDFKVINQECWWNPCLFSVILLILLVLVKTALATVVFLLELLVKVKKGWKGWGIWESWIKNADETVLYFQISCYHNLCWSKMFRQLLSYFGAFGKGKKRVERMDEFRVMNLDCWWNPCFFPEMLQPSLVLVKAALATVVFLWELSVKVRKGWKGWGIWKS